MVGMVLCGMLTFFLSSECSEDSERGIRSMSKEEEAQGLSEQEGTETVEKETETEIERKSDEEGSEEEKPTVVMIAVSAASKGYPNPSISSRHAFQWVCKNLLKPCCAHKYKLLILHVQVLDEDGEPPQHIQAFSFTKHTLTLTLVLLSCCPFKFSLLWNFDKQFLNFHCNRIRVSSRRICFLFDG